VENDQMVMHAIIVRITGKGEIQVDAKRKWTIGSRSLFGETNQNIHLESAGQNGLLNISIGDANGQDLYIPYSLWGCTDLNRATTVEGPYYNGVLHSTNFGISWQLEKISDFRTWGPIFCKTKNYYYFFSCKFGEVNKGLILWSSRKPVSGGEWNAPETVKKPLPYGGCFVALTEGDAVHVCWLDNRHEKRYLNINLLPPNLFSDFGNYEIAYRQLKDSDVDWSKDVILSEGVFNSYNPSMSVDGDKIAIAWSGNQNTHDHWHMGPLDIYYVTSKDGGKTWAKPLKVTDTAKDGLETSAPQVAVQNGIIHLFYVQGKENPHLHVGNQGPWPVYYQQRPFPD